MAGIIIGIVIAIILLIVANTRKGNADMAKPTKLKSFTVSGNILTIQKVIIRYGQTEGLKVNDFDEEQHIIVFSDSATTTSYGFFYPVYLNESNGKVEVEVGVKSKAVQAGAIVNRSHEKVFNGVKAACFAEYIP